MISSKRRMFGPLFRASCVALASLKKHYEYVFVYVWVRLIISQRKGVRFSQLKHNSIERGTATKSAVGLPHFWCEVRRFNRSHCVRGATLVEFFCCFLNRLFPPEVHQDTLTCWKRSWQTTSRPLLMGTIMINFAFKRACAASHWVRGVGFRVTNKIWSST